MTSDSYVVSVTDATAQKDLAAPYSGAWEAASGADISVNVPGLTPGHSYTFSVTQHNDLYASAAGAAGATVPLPATTAPSTVTVSGPPTVGKRLAVKNVGAWETGARLSYVWYAGSTKVGTAASYTPKLSDLGKRIKVKVTGSAAGHTATSRTSAAVGPVRESVYVVKARVTVTGTAQVGNTLTGHIGTLPKGARVKWEWAEGFGRSAGLVRGPKSSATYTIPASGKGGRIVAIALVTVPGELPGGAVSKPTAVVRKR